MGTSRYFDLRLSQAGLEQNTSITVTFGRSYKDNVSMLMVTRFQVLYPVNHHTSRG